MPARKRKRKRKRPSNPNARSRPHKNDFNFPVSFPFTRKGAHSAPPQHVIFALAMSWNRPRDRTRLQMLENNFPGTRVITVSDCNHTQGNMEHITTCFNTARGRHKMRAAIRRFSESSPSPAISVLLDYYWLQEHYYQKRYGTDWLSAGAHELLSAGADHVTLPYDGGWGNSQQTPDMEQMLNGVLHPQIQIEYLANHENPLWVASDQAEIAQEMHRENGTNEHHTAKYLHPTMPFVKVTSRP